MKTLTETLGFGTDVELLHRRLLRNLGVLALGLVGLVMTAVLYFDEKLVRTLSVNLIEQSAAAVQQELSHFFEPLRRSLRVAVRQIQLEDLESDGVLDSLFLSLSPFVLEYDRVDGLSVANMRGDAYVLFESGERDGELLERFTGTDPKDDGKANWRRWHQDVFVEEWRRATDYRPQERPWFGVAEGAPLDEVRWTEPYAFFTTKEPGITAAMRWQKPDTGEVFITALDVSLLDVAHFSMGLQPSPNGKVLMFTDDERIIGLPAFDRFSDEHAFRGALLKPPSALKLPVVDDALAAWREDGRSDAIQRYESGSETWWAGFSTHRYAAEDRIHVVVLVPESDLLADIGNQRNIALSAIVGGGVLTAVFLVLSTVRRVRRQLSQTVSQIERKLGQYRLKQKIGGGGNGDVYLARHALLRRPTAIKIMRPEFARSESAKARFEHEVQITSGLTHPNTIAIYDFGKTPEGTLYYAMELLTGHTLERLVGVKGPLAPARVIHVLDQVCGSLAEAHGRGLIHRDVKPANVMLCERGGLYDVVKVLDFGLVKEAGQDDPGATQANVLVGTPHYMAPEIIAAAGRAGPASDLYALGAAAYYLLTGQNVFDGASTVEVCAKHLHDAPVPPSQRVPARVPADLEAIVLRCLEKDPAARPESAEELAEALHACADCGGWSARDAKEWWRVHQYEFPLGEDASEHTPLSNTELLVDMDDRLERLRRTVGQNLG